MIILNDKGWEVQTAAIFAGFDLFFFLMEIHSPQSI